MLQLTGIVLAQNAPRLTLPALADADYDWIARRIGENETGGKYNFLTYWGAGEDFPSLGIGHFIWFPSGVDAPFDESFPNLVAYLLDGAAHPDAPSWLLALQPFDAPWSSKREFDEALGSPAMVALRAWLAETSSLQARFIVESFNKRWNRLVLPSSKKARLTVILQEMVASRAGLFAVVDYYHFKGLGVNPLERYQGQGWGLIQVLSDIASQTDGDVETDLVLLFSRAAAARLQQRVELSPAARNEVRWLAGWRKRVASYASETTLVPAGNVFRIMPYVQNPASDAMTLTWFSADNSVGLVELRLCGGDESTVYRLSPVAAMALAYHAAEAREFVGSPPPIPYQHALRLSGLESGRNYCYEVTQGEQRITGRFRTAGAADEAVRFIVYGDSETEPESTGKHALWSLPGADLDVRRYLVDQSTGYAENITVMLRRQPDFVAIAGDLVESGGEQRDWDEFWRQNSRLAASIPIVPALGNHEYYGGPGEFGAYSNTASRRAIAKFKTYFETGSYYALDYGPLTLIVVDGNNGVPEKSQSDTNWYLSGEDGGGVAPAWNTSSAQMDWLERELASAQRDKQFTFVMFHAPPYSSGIHGKPPGLAQAHNFASGRPLQALTSLFLRYGVDAVFNGHDEMYEHSVVRGVEEHPDGSQTPHTVHFFTVGIGGDGLRGPDARANNPQSVFLAHNDAPEIYDDNGVLTSGGKHYGHLEVNVEQDASGQWFARIEPVIVFPLARADGRIDSFERRVYDDVTVLGNAYEH